MLCGSYHTQPVPVSGEDQESCRAGNVPLSQGAKTAPGGPGRRPFRRRAGRKQAGIWRQTGDTPARYGQVAASRGRP